MLEVRKDNTESLEKSLKENGLHYYIKQGVQNKENQSELLIRKFVTGVEFQSTVEGY